jgi:hypothetical protein
VPPHRPDPAAPAAGEPADAPDHVQELAARRLAARQARNFAAADDLRDKIADLGWLVTDTAAGYKLAPASAEPPSPGPRYKVLANPAAIPAARPRPGDLARPATIGLLVEGWPQDLRECVEALLTCAPAGVMISALDVGNQDGAGDALADLALAHQDRIEAWHVASTPGWSAGRNALLRADPAPVHVIMETSTILTGDAISPLLAALSALSADGAAEDRVVAAGWRGADPDPDLLSFHDAGPGRVTALLGYLLAVRSEAAAAVGGLPGKARFYRNADLEFSLRLGLLGALVVPDEPLPVRQARHRGYHDSDPEYRERESRRNYGRVLDLLRSGGVR